MAVAGLLCHLVYFSPIGLSKSLTLNREQLCAQGMEVPCRI